MRVRSGAVWLAIIAALLLAGWWLAQWMSTLPKWMTRPLISDRWAVVVSAVLLAIYFGAAMHALFTRRGKQSHADANARGCMAAVTIAAAVLGLVLAIGAFFHIRLLIGVVAGCTGLPAVLTGMNVLTDSVKSLRKKRAARREAAG